MSAWYNENNPFAAEWLRNLIAAGHIAPGDVDTRSIEDVSPDDLRGYTQCHFFAGIGLWSYSLRLAGWPDERPVWTGSCPCQPFSAAGKGAGFADERHLWPAWLHHIRVCRPDVIFGEQVASKDGLLWLDLVFDDLQGEGYALGPEDSCSAGLAAPHKRQRLGFVAHTDDPKRWPERARWHDGDWEAPERHQGDRHAAECRLPGGMGHPGEQRLSNAELEALLGERGWGEGRATEQPGRSFWSDPDWLFCRDRKWRPVERGTFPLVDGGATRMGRLRAYGNAINPEDFAGRISDYLEYERARAAGDGSLSLDELLG